MKEKNEIFTEKDLEDVWKVLNETIVSSVCFTKFRI